MAGRWMAAIAWHPQLTVVLVLGEKGIEYQVSLSVCRVVAKFYWIQFSGESVVGRGLRYRMATSLCRRHEERRVR